MDSSPKFQKFFIALSYVLYMGFPCGSAAKESACNVGNLSSIPGLGRSPGKWKRYPLQYSGLENSATKSWTQQSSFHFHFHLANICFIFDLINHQHEKYTFIDLNVQKIELTSRVQFSSVQLFSRIQLFATPWTIAGLASLSITNSHSLPKLTSIVVHGITKESDTTEQLSLSCAIHNHYYLICNRLKRFSSSSSSSSSQLKLLLPD